MDGDQPRDQKLQADRNLALQAQRLSLRVFPRLAPGIEPVEQLLERHHLVKVTLQLVRHTFEEAPSLSAASDNTHPVPAKKPPATG